LAGTASSVDGAGGSTPPQKVLALAGIIGLIPTRWVFPLVLWLQAMWFIWSLVVLSMRYQCMANPYGDS